MGLHNQLIETASTTRVLIYGVVLLLGTQFVVMHVQGQALNFGNTPVNQVFTNTEGLTFGIDISDSFPGLFEVMVTSDEPNVNINIPDTGNRFAVMNFVDENGAPFGSIIIEIFETRGASAAERFIALATTGFDENGDIDPSADPFYTDVIVHRVTDLTGQGGWIIQTGDAQFGNGTGGSPLGSFDDEFELQAGLNFGAPGMIAMANSGPDTNNSQFFITDGPVSHLNGKHMIFGAVISGRDGIDHILQLPQGANNRPVEAPRLRSVDIFESVAALTFPKEFVDAAPISVTLESEGSEPVTTSFVASTPVFDIASVILAPGETLFSQVIGGNIMYVAAGGSGIFTYDISDPALPQLFGQFNTIGEARNIEIVDYGGSIGKVAFVADTDGGVVILDVDDPAAITELRRIPVTSVNTSNLNGDAYDIDIDDNFVLFVATSARSNSFAGGLTAFNVSSASNPIRLSSLSLVSGDTSLTMKSVIARGNIGYVTADNFGLLELDISDPADLTGAGFLISNVPIANSWGIDIDGDQLFMANSGTDTSNGGMLIFDISTPPINVDSGDLLAFQLMSRNPWQIKAANGFAAIGHLGGGIRIFDVSSPTAPVLRFSSTKSAVGRPFIDTANGHYYFPMSGSSNRIRILEDTHLTDPEVGVLFGNSRLTTGKNSVDFGTLVEGQATRVLTFTIENSGKQSLTVADIRVPDGFAVNNTVPDVIGAGQAATLEIRLDGIPAGDKAGPLEIDSDDFDEGTFQITVTGSVTGNSSVNGAIWIDADGDQNRGGNEVAASGVTIYVDANNNGTRDSGEIATTSDASGNFDLLGIAAGNHNIRVVLPVDFEQTVPSAQNAHAISLAVGETVDAGDIFGIRAIPGSISGVIWEDNDEDGKIDETENRLTGFRAYVDTNEDGILNGTEISTITDSTGAFSLQDIIVGTHTVRFVMDPDYFQTFPAGDSGHSVVVDAAETVTGINFGVKLLPGSIRGLVWLDNGIQNGSKESDEPGLAGAVIYLDLDDNGTLDAGDPRRLIAADGNVNLGTLPSGVYEFDGLPPKDYTVRTTVSPAYTRILPTDGDSYAVSLLPDTIESDLNFGYTGMPVLIQGEIWHDSVDNDVRDDGETGFAGVAVSVYSDNGDDIFDFGDADQLIGSHASAVGAYGFDGLIEGDYWIEIDEQSAVLRGFGLLGRDNPQRFSVAAGPLIKTFDYPMTQLSETSYRMILEQGWNLVAIDVDPLDPTISSVWSGLDSATLSDPSTFPIAGTVWEWAENASMDRLQSVTELHPRNGYWIFANQHAEFLITGYPVTDADLRLSRGWSLIGALGTVAAPSAPSVHTVTWGWEANQRFLSRGLLEEGAGYWTYSDKQMLIRLE